MGVIDKRFGEPTGEVLAQPPHRLGDVRQGRLGFGKLGFQVIEPLIKAIMEWVAQGRPLFACTHLG